MTRADRAAVVVMPRRGWASIVARRQLIKDSKDGSAQGAASAGCRAFAVLVELLAREAANEFANEIPDPISLNDQTNNISHAPKQ